jgi:tRNA (cytidine/uridine-2'-O-)-methyltransferase
MIQIALIHPEIPQNTGNIARLCVGLDVTLHLVHPLGFHITDKQVKRAGLDYWEHLKLVHHDSLESFEKNTKDKRLILFENKTEQTYTNFTFDKNDILCFGSESSGMPDDFCKRHQENMLLIPTPGQVRSINLSNSVAIGAYEAFRQLSGNPAR